MQRMIARPGVMGANRMRPIMQGQKVQQQKRIAEFKPISAMRARPPMYGRGIRSLQGSLSITKIPNKTPKKSSRIDSDEDTQVLDSEDESNKVQDKSSTPPNETNISENRTTNPSDSTETENSNDSTKPNKNESLVLTTDEKLPTEEALEIKSVEENSIDFSRSSDTSLEPPTENVNSLQSGDRIEKKINLLKNYRHQRPGNRPPTESSLSQLERTASVLTKESMPDFRRNLDDITQSYSPTNEEKNVKSKKKKSPNKMEGSESQDKPSMSHSVSSMLGPSGSTRKSEMPQNLAPVAPIEHSVHHRSPLGMPHEPPMVIPPALVQPSPPTHMALNMSHGTLLTAGSPTPAGEVKAPHVGMPIPHPHPSSAVLPHSVAPPTQPYGPNPPPEGYGQYPPGNI